MKTAMQEHIEWLKATLEICKENAPSLINCLKLCLKDAESKLEMEKEQIKNAYKHGQNNGYMYKDGNSNIIQSKEYYNETFKSE